MQQEELLFDKLGEHEERLVRIEDKLVKIEDKVDKIDDRLVRVEGKLDKVEDRVFTVEQDVKDIKKTMATKDDLRALEDRLLTRDDRQIALLTTIRDEQAATNHALIRHENKLNEHDGAIKQLQTDFSGFQTKPQAI